MKKKLGVIKLQIISGKATPAPPVGPALGQKGINIMEFCKIFNEKTKQLNNLLLSVKIQFYLDKSFDFVCKKSTLTFLIKDLKGYKNLSLVKDDKIINYSDVINLAKYKLFDMNTKNLYSAVKIVSGTIKTMGFIIKN